MKSFYTVIATETVYDGEGHWSESSRVLGTTYAVSEKQACNNVSRRTGIRNAFVPYPFDGFRRTVVSAKAN